MEKTWKPTTAGILSIAAGAFGVIGGILAAKIGAIGGGILGEHRRDGIAGQARRTRAISVGYYRDWRC